MTERQHMACALDALLHAIRLTAPAACDSLSPADSDELLRVMTIATAHLEALLPSRAPKVVH